MKPSSDQRQANRAWEERIDNGRDTASSATDRLPSADYLRALAIALLIFSVSFISYSRTLPPNADEMMNYALAESIAKLGRGNADNLGSGKRLLVTDVGAAEAGPDYVVIPLR